MDLPLKLERSAKRRHAMAGGRVEILYPGLSKQQGDSGISAIGRIDHARLAPGKTIAMHPHRDDEILTYVRAGTMLHRDTVGDEERITPTRLMLMNAGHTFQHEEEMTGDVPIEVLQIFIRPSAPDLEPRVQFHDFAEAVSHGRWRIIAGPEGEAPLTLRAQAWVRDVRLGAGETLPIPDGDAPSAVRLVYVFAGAATVDGVTLEAGDSLLLPAGPRTVEARGEADVVLFTTDPAAPAFAGGMFSGNVLRA